MHRPTICLWSLLVFPPALSSHAPLLTSKPSAEECHHLSLVKVRELNCFFAGLGKKKTLHVGMDRYDSYNLVECYPVVMIGKYKVQVELHQGSALSPLLFITVMDRLLGDARQDSPV